MTGGSGTLSGGAGNDTFNLAYSAKKKISAVIEDIDPTKDKIIITYDGDTAPKLTHSISGGDVIWTDDKGYFNLTLKGSSDASDYYEGTPNDYIWDILWITNRERETEKLEPLTLSQGLMDGAAIRAPEIIETDSHTRPDGSSCFTAVKKSYWSMGENLAWGYTSPEEAMVGWMNSLGHRANILTADFEKLGVGYAYDENSTKYKDNWVQMFGGGLTEPDTLSTSKILKTPMTLQNGDISASNSSKLLSGTKSADYLRNGVKGAKISALGGNDTIKNYGASASINAGAGNDYIFNNGSKVSINGGAGDDTIDNRGSKVTINAGDGNDSVKNYASNVSIDGGKNNDFIINGGYFEDERGGSKISISGGDGNDTITSHGNNSRLNGGSGNDLIYNGYRYYAPGDAFYDSDSDDYNGNNATIFGGKGNDTIKNLGNNVVFVYSNGAGNDVIEGFNETSNLSISGGAYALLENGKDVIVNVGKGNVTLKGAGNLSALNINGTKSATLTVTNTTPSPVEINSSVKIVNASARTKAVQITGNKLANTISGGSKNDTLYGGKGHDSLVGNAGNDKIYGGTGNDCIIGGAGNDSLWGDAGADKFIYSGGDGKDVILGFDDKDTLTLDGLDFTSSYKNDILTLKVSGGSITLKDFSATTFHINDDTYHINSKNKLVK